MTETVDESKRNRRTAKRILAIGLPLVLIGSVGLGYAYWTGASGTGSGNATTAAAAPALTVSSSVVPTNMAPGVGPSGVTVTVKNTSATQNVYARQVAVVITSVSAAGCDATDYVLGGTLPMVDAAGDLAPGGTATFTGATLGFNNKTGTNQDACKGATVTLGFTAS